MTVQKKVSVDANVFATKVVALIDAAKHIRVNANDYQLSLTEEFQFGAKDFREMLDVVLSPLKRNENGAFPLIIQINRHYATMMETPDARLDFYSNKQFLRNFRDATNMHLVWFVSSPIDMEKPEYKAKQHKDASEMLYCFINHNAYYYVGMNVGVPMESVPKIMSAVEKCIPGYGDNVTAFRSRQLKQG